MARRKDKEKQKETQLEKTRKRIWGAKTRLEKTLLGPLLGHVRLVECDGTESDPEMACVDPAQGVVWVNPHRRHDLGEPEWSFVLAHQLLHLGLGHGAGRVRREPKAWNLACEHAADNMLYALKIGKAPHDYEVDLAFAAMSEDAIYEALVGDKPALEGFKTYAGARRPDLVTRPTSAAMAAYGSASQTTRYGYAKPRKDWETLLAEGIRAAVEDAVEEAAETLGEAAADKRKVWRPGEAARRWVLSEMPLLGAVAAHMTIIADETLCERMDISVAAVDAYLGEIYFNPKWGLSAAEVLFVYAHELLHAALLHHTRGRGRDPWLWNIACDFVINDWLVEMGVGKFPSLGLLYDPRLRGMSSDEVYDLLLREPGRCKSARGFRGALGDVLFESESRRIYRGDVSTLDDFYRRCLSAGMSSIMGRGTLPAGLVEEIRSLWTPPVPWDVALARWMEAHVPVLRDPIRTYARASRRQSSTPDIPRPARFVPQEDKDAHTFGVVLDTSGSMDRELLGRALGAIASYAEARDVAQIRLVLCDAAPYDRGFVAPADLRGVFAVTGRGGTVLQPAVSFLLRQGNFPTDAPIMVITDGWCEVELLVPRDHCFLLPRKGWNEGTMILRTSAPVFRVLKEEHYDG